MSLAMYIVLDHPEPGFDTFVDGKALASAADELNDLCEQEGLEPLDSFVGQSESELDGFSDERRDANEDEQDPWAQDSAEEAADWWDAAEGVAWINAVIELIEENPDALEDPDGVLGDLGDFLHVLEKAQAARIRWHFAWDF